MEIAIGLEIKGVINVYANEKLRSFVEFALQ